MKKSRKEIDADYNKTDRAREVRRNSWHKHKEKRVKESIERRRLRILNDPAYKVLEYSRIRLRNALKGKNKSASTKELLGCTPEELKMHLESQFTEGMTWDNYGKGGWEVDHIKECYQFDFTKEGEQKKCFHYTNLQPLWQEENLQKSINIRHGENKVSIDKAI